MPLTAPFFSWAAKKSSTNGWCGSPGKRYQNSSTIQYMSVLTPESSRRWIHEPSKLLKSYLTLWLLCRWKVLESLTSLAYLWFGLSDPSETSKVLEVATWAQKQHLSTLWTLSSIAGSWHTMTFPTSEHVCPSQLLCPIRDTEIQILKMKCGPLSKYLRNSIANFSHVFFF